MAGDDVDVYLCILCVCMYIASTAANPDLITELWHVHIYECMHVRVCMYECACVFVDSSTLILDLYYVCVFVRMHLLVHLQLHSM